MKEKIKAKIEELAKAKEQTIAQLNAIIGAEQALIDLIDENGEGD